MTNLAPPPYILGLSNGNRFILGYRPALDGVRAVAILSVITFHYRRDPLALPTRGGFLGVEIFFVLSGFLITTLLCQERARTGRLSLRLFYARRALRLLPAFFVMLGVYVTWALTLGPDRLVGAELKEAAGAAFYVENLLRAFVPHHAANPPGDGLVPTWTLSTEEQFYLLWPVALLLLARMRGLRRATVVVAGSYALAAVLRAVFYDGSQWHLFFFIRPDALLPGCLLGLLLTGGVRWSPPRWLAWLAAGVVAFFLMAAPWNADWLFSFGFTLFALSCMVVIWALMTTPDWTLTRVLELPPLVGIGRISYGMYLWHMPAFVFVEAYSTHLRITIPAALALTFAVSLTSYRYLEQPFLRLKRRLAVVGTPVPEAPPDAVPVSA